MGKMILRELLALLIMCCYVAPLTSFAVQESRSGGVNTVLFGVKLDRPATMLLAEVEQGFGKKVRPEWLLASDWMNGRAEIDKDGTPVVQLNPNAVQHDVIVHELYHLRLKLQGYPAIMWSFSRSMDNDTTRATFTSLAAKLNDPIVHSMFYRQAHRNGIDPGRTYKNGIIQQLNDGTIAKLIPMAEDRDIALNFFNVLMEFGEGAVAQKIEALLVKLGKGVSRELGRKLYLTVKRLKPVSPETSITTLVTCLNLLYAGEWVFVERPWEKLSKGSFTERLAIIELRAA